MLRRMRMCSGVCIKVVRSVQLRACAFLLALVVARAAGAPGAERFPYEFLDEAAEAGAEYSVYYELTPTRIWTRTSEARIAFDVRDEDNLRYAALSRGRVALVEVSAKQPKELAVSDGFQPTGAAKVTVQRRADHAVVIADGVVLLRGTLPPPPGGKVGAGSSDGSIRCLEGLLQTTAPVYFTDDFTRAAGEMAGWEIVSGVWENTEVKAPGADPVYSVNPFSLGCNAPKGGLITGGYWFWDGYRAQISVKPIAAQSVGLCTYLQDEASYLLFRWRAGDDKAPRAKQLVVVRDGRERILAEAPGGFAEGWWYRLELECGDGAALCSIDREPVLRADTDAFGQGSVALWAEGDAVAFDDVAVLGPGVEPPRAHANEAFVQDTIMNAQGLYNPEGNWRAGTDGAYWHCGLFFGDVTIRLPADLARAGDLTLALRATEPDTATGYLVVLHPEGDQLRAEIRRGGVGPGEGQARLGPDDEVTVAWREGRLSVRAADTEVASVAEPDPPTGRRVAVVSSPSPMPATLSQLTVTADNWLDNTFSHAPTDWYATKGTWQVTTRWPCEPRWTFFGGVHYENPVAWTKHTYAGDIAFEARANIQMDLRSSPGYSDPSDVNLALCGDGMNLDSGYAFVYAGWGNQKSAILRKGEVVAENTKAVFIEPTSGNENFHRHWFRLRAEKLGSQIRFLADDRLVCEYTDPDPLPGGRVALWSAGNNLMVARAQLWYETEEPAPLPLLPEPPPGREPSDRGDVRAIANDFERDMGEWHTLDEPVSVRLDLDDTTASKGGRSLRITNLRPGGPMAAYALTEGFRARDWHRLQLDYRIPPGVKVDVYLYMGNEWHTVRLTGNTPRNGAAKPLGEFADVQANGNWHHAEFDLLPALRAIYPQRQVFSVDYLALASPDERYLRCGLGGNAMGATFWIDEFRLTP